MPSDANGVYSLPAGYLAVTGDTIQASQHNPPLEDIATAITSRLMRSGAAPMTGPLLLVEGSASAPAVQLGGATGRGFYWTADGFAVAVGGSMVAEFTTAGLRKGARWIGELVPFTGLTAPSLTVLPYGQTLSRTTYADLWAFAQTEIAGGNAFYNNGNGTTTFGIGDMRGRVAAGNDSMGGVAAGWVTSGNFGSSPSVVGNVGGTETHTLTQAQMPAHQHAATVSDPGHTHSSNAVANNGTAIIGASNFSQPTYGVGATINSAVTGISVSIDFRGSSSAHPNMQPTMITNFVLFAGA